MAHVLGLDAFNLGDRLYRNHLSFIKDRTPRDRPRRAVYLDGPVLLTRAGHHAFVAVHCPAPPAG
jgi:hypothetical protein